MPIYSFVYSSSRFSNDKMSVAIVSTEMAQIGIPIHYEMVKRSIHSSVFICTVYKSHESSSAHKRAHIVCVYITIRLVSHNGCN